MALYAVGDIQGCYDSLRTLLDRVAFNPSSDHLYLCGDLVNRGPKSLETLRYLSSIDFACTSVLGNHDIHLLAQAYTDHATKKQDTLEPILQAPDREVLLRWLRHQPILCHIESLNTVIVHAGIAPQWDLATAKSCALELESQLKDEHAIKPYLESIYSDSPDTWSEDLQGMERLRFITNAFTRMRFCDTQGTLNLREKNLPGLQAKNLIPWFECLDDNRTEFLTVIGHWSTLGFYRGNNILALDTGCVWGGLLTAVRLDSDQWLPISVSGKETLSIANKEI